MLKHDFDGQLSENEKVPRNKILFKIQKILLDFLEWSTMFSGIPHILKMEEWLKVKRKNVFSRPK